MLSVPFLVLTNASLNIIVVVSCVTAAVGWVPVVLAESAITIISGLALVGFGGGVTVMFMNTYIAEISPEHHRRVTSGGIGFCMFIGLFITFLPGIWLSFRWMAVVVLGGVVLFVCLVSFIPHSPVWYTRQGFEQR